VIREGMIEASERAVGAARMALDVGQARVEVT
jgi:hypothetical protein